MMVEALDGRDRVRSLFKAGSSVREVRGDLRDL